jgi:hypothetical protein
MFIIPMLNLTKPRPFFGSSVTQNTQADHTHKLELYTGAGLHPKKKEVVYNKAPKPNLKSRRDFSREIPTEISKFRNNELPFKQILVNKERNTATTLIDENRKYMVPDSRRQNLPGFTPTGYTGVRKPVTLGAVYNLKKHTKRIITNVPGKINLLNIKPTVLSKEFRETNKEVHMNIYEKNKRKKGDYSKKQKTPSEYVLTDNMTTRNNTINGRSNKVNTQVSGQEYIFEDKERMYEETPANLSFPKKIRARPNIEKSENKYPIPNRDMARFVGYEPFAGNEMSFRSKPAITSDYKTPQTRAFKVNNISPAVTIVDRGKKGIALSGHHEINRPDTSSINTVSGNKAVHNMVSTWKHSIPKRIVAIEGMNRTEA